MSEYETLGQMKKIHHNPNGSIQYFLPHHSMFKEWNMTTKLSDSVYSDLTYYLVWVH